MNSKNFRLFSEIRGLSHRVVKKYSNEGDRMDVFFYMYKHIWRGGAYPHNTLCPVVHPLLKSRGIIEGINFEVWNACKPNVTLLIGLWSSVLKLWDPFLSFLEREVTKFGREGGGGAGDDWIWLRTEGHTGVVRCFTLKGKPSFTNIILCWRRLETID